MNKYYCAAGALGLHGKGHWWSRPFKTAKLTAITKTLTFHPNRGNYRWWKFWKTFRINLDYTVNALGLPNPGYLYWITNMYPRITDDIVPSICPFTPAEAQLMVSTLSEIKLHAIEINISCPNTHYRYDATDIIRAALKATKHQLFVKVGAQHNYMSICAEFGNEIVIDAINSVPWNMIQLDQSPLHPLEGGMSSRDTSMLARHVLKRIKTRYPEIKVISGNGIFDYDEAKARFDLGADAITFGTIYNLTPWRPAQIIERLENGRFN